MLNNKEPFLFFASIPPYTKLVPFGIMESNYQIPKESKKRQQIFDQENVWGKSGLHRLLGYTVGKLGITEKFKQK